MVIEFTGERHKYTSPLVIKVVLYVFNTNIVKAASEKEVVTFFNGPLNKNKNTPINQTG